MTDQQDTLTTADGPPLYIVGAKGWQVVPYGAECWGVNNCTPEAQGFPSNDFNITGWFQMHEARLWRRGRNTREHIRWLKQLHPFPIWMQEQHADVPSSQEYPLKAAEALWPERLGPGFVFSDSFCYMLALAILQGRSHVELRGVYLDDHIESMTETEGVAYWIAIAAVSRVRVGSDGRFLLPFRYGYEVRHPHPSLPDDVAAYIIASEHPGARALLNRYREARKGAGVGAVTPLAYGIVIELLTEQLRTARETIQELGDKYAQKDKEVPCQHRNPRLSS